MYDSHRRTSIVRDLHHHHARNVRNSHYFWLKNARVGNVSLPCKQTHKQEMAQETSRFPHTQLTRRILAGRKQRRQPGLKLPRTERCQACAGRSRAAASGPAGPPHFALDKCAYLGVEDTHARLHSMPVY